MPKASALSAASPATMFSCIFRPFRQAVFAACKKARRSSSTSRRDRKALRQKTSDLSKNSQEKIKKKKKEKKKEKRKRKVLKETKGFRFYHPPAGRFFFRTFSATAGGRFPNPKKGQEDQVPRHKGTKRLGAKNRPPPQ